MTKKHDAKIRVRAKVQGQYGQVREPGAVFHLNDPAHFSGRWMEHINEDGSVVEDSPLQEEYDDRADYLRRRAAAIAAKQSVGEITDAEIEQFAPKRRKARAGARPDASDEGVYAPDGTLIQEQQTGSPLVQKGAVGHPGQDDKSRPNAFDARHEIEQDFSSPHQLGGGKDGKDGKSRK